MEEKEITKNIYKSILRIDAQVREEYEARRNIPATDRRHEAEKIVHFSDIVDMPDGFVFDEFANHALYFYAVGLAQEVRCVGRFLDTGLAMPESRFGK